MSLRMVAGETPRSCRSARALLPTGSLVETKSWTIARRTCRRRSSCATVTPPRTGRRAVRSAREGEVPDAAGEPGALSLACAPTQAHGTGTRRNRVPVQHTTGRDVRRAPRGGARAPGGGPAARVGRLGGGGGGPGGGRGGGGGPGERRSSP